MLRTKTQRSADSSTTRDAEAALLGSGLSGALAEEGEDGFLFGGEGLEGCGEHGEFEQPDEEGRGHGEADVAAAFAQMGGVADEQAEADRVEALELGEREDEAVELERGQVEGGLEGLGFGAEDDAAGAANDVDVAGKARLESEWHGVLSLGVLVRRV